MANVLINYSNNTRYAVDELTSENLYSFRGLGHEFSKKIATDVAPSIIEHIDIYDTDRQDLADPELAEIAVLEQFLPAALSEEEIEKVVAATITKLGASGMKDMGKVMGVVSNALSGQADGKVISTLVKKLLMN